MNNVFVPLLHPVLNLLPMECSICNTDRHFGNFGFMVDNKSNTIVASAQTLSAYADTLLPCVYDDFLGTVQKVLSSELREGLRRLVEFKFQLHPRYNWPQKRIRLVEQQVQNTAK